MKTFQKHDQNKSRLDLLPPKAIELVGYVLAHGIKKYPEGNWKLCKDPNRYVAALLRHAMAELSGEDLDPESQLFHLAHAACCALIALEIKIGKSRDFLDEIIAESTARNPEFPAMLKEASKRRASKTHNGRKAPSSSRGKQGQRKG